MEHRRINFTKIKKDYTRGLVQLCVLFSQSVNLSVELSDVTPVYVTSVSFRAILEVLALCGNINYSPLLLQPPLHSLQGVIQDCQCWHRHSA